MKSLLGRAVGAKLTNAKSTPPPIPLEEWLEDVMEASDPEDMSDGNGFESSDGAVTEESCAIEIDDQQSDSDELFWNTLDCEMPDWSSNAGQPEVANIFQSDFREETTP